MLKLHPALIAPDKKELHFFDVDDRYAKGLESYLEHFPFKAAFSKKFVAFESTPAYLYEAHKTASRIHGHLPNVVCIAILRDPVKRAYSAWNMNHHFKGHPQHEWMYDPRSFAQAIEDELAGRTTMKQHTYLACSNYAAQLAYFKELFPARQLWLYSYKELKNNPDKLVGNIVQRLGLPPMPVGTSVRDVKVGVRPYAEKLDPAMAKELYQYFEPGMRRLNEVLGCELDILEQHA